MYIYIYTDNIRIVYDMLLLPAILGTHFNGDPHTPMSTRPGPMRGRQTEEGASIPPSIPPFPT